MSTKKIIDCFTFYNEFDLLLYRLCLLNDQVDHFVIVEATYTHSGNQKRLYFNDVKHLFDKFKDKIIHIIVDDFPYKFPNFDLKKNHHWANENHQRNCIARGLNLIKMDPHDIIIISDLDEIPDPSTLLKIREGEIPVNINALEMDFYYYNLNSKIEDKWYYSKVISYEKYRELNTCCENIRKYPWRIIKNGGWHLSYFGDSKFIKNKIEQFAHQEFNNSTFTDLEHIDICIKNSTDLYKRDSNKIQKISIKDNTYLPPYYDVFLSKFFNSEC